jgi:uncharacterized protein (DUF885 family)
MSQEQPKQGNKLTVVLDRSPEVEAIRKELETEKTKNAKNEELIKSYIAESAERERAERVNDPPKPPVGGDTSTLDRNGKQREFVPNFDFDNSTILDMNPKFKSREEAIAYVKRMAENPLSADHAVATKMYQQLIKRSLDGNGTFEYQGNMARWENVGGKCVKASRPKTFKRVD